MKKIMLAILVCLLILTGSYFLLKKSDTKESQNQVTAKEDKAKEELEAFKKDNESLVYDIYYFNPDDNIEEKRASLFERMTEPLVEQMCPNIPELVDNMKVWNDILEVETVEVIDLSDNKRETVTNYQIKTSEGQTFDLSSRAIYEKQNNKWIMTDITPEEREA